MKQTSVVKVESTDRGIIIHHYADKKKKAYAAIRAGLSWPTEEVYGYFIILGEEYLGGGTAFEGQPPKRGKILLLAEQEIQSHFLNDTLKALTDECALVGCHNVYAQFEEEPELNMEEVRLARELLNKQEMSISLLPAPYHKSFKLGVDIIRFFLSDALLDLPETSLAGQQLATLSQTDLSDKPEVKFVAVNGLRFAVGAFHKYVPDLGRPYRPNRHHEYRPYNVKRPRW